MKKTLVLLLTLGIVSSFMVACNQLPNQDANTTSFEEEVTPVAEGTWPRTIVDGAGNEIVLEEKAERITLLHIIYMEYLLALDSYPTAAAIGNAFGETEGLEKSELFSPYLGDFDIKLVGNSKDLNLEAILESNPDLLLTFHNPAGIQAYDQLVEIAPVVQLDYNSTWQDQLLMIGNILGKEDLAEQVIKDTENTIADAKEKIEKDKDKSFALFRTDGKSFIAQGNSKYYDIFGLTKPEGFPDTAKPGDTTSLEAVSDMNPDYIVFQHNYEMAKSFVDSMEASPVWQSMDAVKNKQIYYFDENMNSYGPLTLKLAAEKLTEMYSE